MTYRDYDAAFDIAGEQEYMDRQEYEAMMAEACDHFDEIEDNEPDAPTSLSHALAAVEQGECSSPHDEWIHDSFINYYEYGGEG
jgi:hypothetical protein